MRKLSTFLFLILVTSFGLAQEQKNELGLLLGGTVTPSLTTQAGAPVEFNSGIAFQADYAHRLRGAQKTSLWLEFPVLASPSVGTSSSDTTLPKETATFFATPSLRLKFAPDKTFSPWLSFGGGLSWYQQANELLSGAPRTLGERNTFRGALQWGGGVDVKTPVKLKFPIGLRGEVRDFYTFGTSNFISPIQSANQHNLAVSGGIVLKFK